MMMTAMPASECETQRLVGNGTLFQLPLHFGPNCDTDQLGVNFRGEGEAYDSSLSLPLPPSPPLRGSCTPREFLFLCDFIIRLLILRRSNEGEEGWRAKAQSRIWGLHEYP
ncbi:hypothetical protein NPIL_176781 [Nephila pilipes]|uniref:Uncharacterized protein n=1 Tax=Nephila pilipes TaxID=299642 RepID=A0A8X6QIP5_NEPPI|nr:hypothetical protein NPIL_176781 [Nephila pilipes]